MIIPYLHFQGNCEEAFNLYAEVFSGKIEYISRHSEQAGSPEALFGKVMHAHLSLGEMGAFDGSDWEQPLDYGNAIALIIHCKSRIKAQEIVDGLSRSGSVISDFKPNPPPDDDSLCGVVKDKFGYQWIVVSPNE